MFTDVITHMAVLWPAMVCGVVLSLTTAATAIAVRYHRAKETDDAGDQLFWDLFAGAAVAVPAVVVSSLSSPAAGLTVAAAGAAAGIGTYRQYPRLAALQQQRRQRNAALSGLGNAVERHQRILARWRRYELDPALAIDFPAMSDVRRPETAQLIRAIRSLEAVSPADEPERYSLAVERLEHALQQAEAAAGARPEAQTP